MFTNNFPLQSESRLANQLTQNIEREGLSPLHDQKGFPGCLIVAPLPTGLIRNSKLVGFERGAGVYKPLLEPGSSSPSKEG
jgi:hypothetical protein